MTTSAPTTILRTVDKPRLRVIGEPIPTPRRPPNEQLRPREFLTAQEEPAIFALSRTCIARGTGSSNPSPSSSESANFRSLSGSGHLRTSQRTGRDPSSSSTPGLAEPPWPSRPQPKLVELEIDDGRRSPLSQLIGLRRFPASRRDTH